MNTLYKLVKGDIVILWGKVRNVRDDGKLDIEVERGKLLWGVSPKIVSMAADPEGEDDDDTMD